MSVHVIIPWHGGNDDERLAALGWVQHQWRSTCPDWRVTIGMLSADSDWCKADAVHIGIRDAHASGDDILVITDADVWTDAAEVALAVYAVESERAAWALPHSNVHRLSQQATAAVLTSDMSPVLAAGVHGHDRQPYLGTVGGGTTILRAADYEHCPIDPRFVGWGQEDESWGDALRTVLGHRHRGNGDLYHLWHPPLPRMAPGIGSLQGKHLRAQYAKYVGDEVAMMRLIEAGRSYLIAD